MPANLQAAIKHAASLLETTICPCNDGECNNCHERIRTAKQLRAIASAEGEQPRTSIEIPDEQMPPGALIARFKREHPYIYELVVTEALDKRTSKTEQPYHHKIFDHKFLDPACVETGCQSLAIAETRRATLLEAAKLVCLRCRDGSNPSRAVPPGAHWWHPPDIPGDNACPASAIHDAIRALEPEVAQP